MKKAILISVIAIFFSSTAFPQNSYRVPNEINAIKLTQGHMLHTLSGFGATSIAQNSISQISSGNPASLFDYHDLSFGVSNQFGSKIAQPWGPEAIDIAYKQANYFLPHSVGILLPKKVFRLGFGFAQKYNSILEYEDMNEAFDKTVIFGFSSILSYSFQNLISNDLFNMGMRFDIDRMDYASKIWHAKLKVQDYSNSWSVGARYDIKLGSSLKVILGSFFDKGPRFETRGSYSGLQILYPEDFLPDYPGKGSEEKIIIPQYSIKAELPNKLHFGFLVGFKNTIDLAMQFIKVYWNQVDKTYNNNTDISGSIICRPHKKLTASIGFISNEKKSDILIYFPVILDDNLKAFFITGGLVFHLKKIDVGFSYANSNNSESGEWYKQSIGKIELGYYFR